MPLSKTKEQKSISAMNTHIMLPKYQACTFATYLVYHEKGNKVLEGLNYQLPELKCHEGWNSGKILLNVTGRVTVALGSKMDPLFLLWDEKLGAGRDPPVRTGGHPSKKLFWAPRSPVGTRQRARFLLNSFVNWYFHIPGHLTCQHPFPRQQVVRF